MIWHLIKYLISIILPTFYKRIQGKNVKNIQVKAPIIIAMNHPNAFTDPIAFTYVTYPVRPKYLARGDAFKPGIGSWFLERLGIVPIFRIQDGGKEGLKKNDEAYIRVNKLLSRNHKIMVFAEGLCIQERRLRPLKKGVARMVFGAYEYLKNDKLLVVPVGVNYSQPDKFRSTVFYNIGEPIPVKDFYEEYKKNPAKTNNVFLQFLEPKMKELITHINNKHYDQAVIHLEFLLKAKLIKQQGLDHRNLEHDYLISKQITEAVNAAEQNNKSELDEFTSKAKSYFADLRKNKLRDWLIDPDSRISSFKVLARILLIILGSPFYLAGMICHYLPYIATQKIVSAKVKNREFYSSFAIGVGLILFWLNLGIWFTVIYYFSPTILMPLGALVVLVLCGWFTLHFHFFIIKTFGMLRAVKNKELVSRFSQRRAELMALVNKFLPFNP
jgi:1-acyl-sn-glycerol-3-phosphate acyltransferase